MKRLVSPVLLCGCQTEPPSSYATTNRYVWCFGYYQGVTAADSEVRDSWLTGSGRVPEGTAKSGGIIIDIFFWTRCTRRCVSLQRTKTKKTGRENMWVRDNDSQLMTDFSGWSGSMMNREGSTPVAQGTAGARPPPSSQREAETEREGEERRLGCACLFSSICFILDMATVSVSSMRHKVNAPSALWESGPSASGSSRASRWGWGGLRASLGGLWLGTVLILVSLSAKP